jgi:hypothetical protein
LRELTAVDHARIRLQLVLIPVWLWLFYGWRDLLQSFPLGLPGSNVHYARDFIQFYIQGVMARERNAPGLYDIDVWAAMVPRIVPGATDLRYPPIYGPQMSVLFSPLASFSYTTAMAVWVGVGIAVYLGCGYAVWKACPRLRDRPWTAALLLLADPGLHFTLAFVQVSPIGLLCVTSAFFALRAGRPFLAGLTIGALVYKPQLGLAAAFIFVFAREWRIVLGAITGAALELAVGCLYWGPSILGAYVQSLVRLLPEMSEKFEPFKFHMHSWRGFFDVLGLPRGVAMGAYVIVAGIILIVALRCWRSRGPLAVRYAVFLVATVLVDPHLYVYDFILLMPAFLLLWDWTLGLEHRTVRDVLPSLPLGPLRKRSFSASCQWLLYFCYFSPLFTIVALVLHLQLSVLALSLLGLVLAGCLLSTSRQPVGELPGAGWNPSNPYGC